MDHTFEGYVAAGLGEFAKAYDERTDYFAIAETNERVVGSIAIVGQADQTAQLRWFLVHPSTRGAGLGRRLLDGALQFCRDREFTNVFLWTISGLEAASHLYQDAGFRLSETHPHQIWGEERTEERYDLILRPSNMSPGKELSSQ